MFKLKNLEGEIGAVRVCRSLHESKQYLNANSCVVSVLVRIESRGALGRGLLAIVVWQTRVSRSSQVFLVA